MNPAPNQNEIRDILLENQRLLIENKALLEKMNKRAVHSMWMRWVYIAVTLFLPYLVYVYYVQPMLGKVTDSTSNLPIKVEQIDQLQDLLKTLKAN